jgi:cytochrome bd ubiquinol oxidase subunit II
MSEVVVFAFMAVSLVLYAVTGGADFGVGILELFASKQERHKIRQLGEHSIAPIWEANHIWLIIALVILFIAFPLLHVRITTYLHIPLLIMLAGIMLRGTAFTFRYYDIDKDPASQKLWTVLFRSGSVIVPMAFGHLVGSLSRGKIPQSPEDVWTSYWAPWLGAFPFTLGLFTSILFAWIACLFLLGEVSEDEKVIWVKRSRYWTVALIICGGVVALIGWSEEVKWLTALNRTPLALVSLWGASLAVILIWKQLTQNNVWLIRFLVGLVVTFILSGYWGAHFPNIVELSNGSSITWHETIAPKPTLDALAGALVGGSFLILPGLFYLFKIFKAPAKH